ncbi:MAG: YggS family pyridoxal phosphate-dependent enzyme [Rhodospirillaceae bacterium]|jgi:PLP dependent protein|nr:YggS family pyridoxal phosphate-dependent enzyme [Rhodospirillaceae bacterium]MBT5434030.1 YggS family pyridoxal phosphate-dependent enzyme [Rhodospirillaceae bacterium]MBT6203304.1 YggS family pyridoxal phosphate-dependent enzyme [Rhodospirillaceae bacterium]MBT6510142.1 YggS family pyridoxal phosphate-dependent enzyme [Rhodospirillaceae bacterium]MBT7614424.1 YggS family pyridoxal phosphate-dependent enzyme [Rhodospirillaceae bacterium]
MSQTDVIANLATVKEEIAMAARTSGRAVDAVTLVAVSKIHDAGHIRPTLEAGHRVFGENRVQEAQGKWPGLKADFDGVELHLIGPLQTNKADDAVELFDVIESVDRLKLVNALARAMEKIGRRPACFIQVNTGEEDQKAGCLPDETDALVKAAREAGLDVIGLMCIPPFDEEPSLHFALLAEIARRNGLEQLSMGMSGDYETAVTFGATHVRVGTAIFGSRSDHV